MRLMREVRCYLGSDAEPTNTWAGTSETTSLRGFAVFRAVVEGPIDPRTGYLCDIRDIDAVVRDVVAPSFHEAQPDPSVEHTQRTLASAFRAAASRLRPPIALDSLELSWSLFTRLTVTRKDPTMVQLTQSFEFAAAHRLHCADLSPEENARLFGKCANPNGHGHNYILEVTISNVVDKQGVSIAELDRTVRSTVLDPFDHKNLNIECPDFTALNPTVENIAKVIWRRLVGSVRPAELNRVRVWETGKTYAECLGDENS